MASASALIRSEIRRTSAAASKAFGRLSKTFGPGPLNGAGTSIGINGRTTISRIPGFPSPRGPTTPFPRPPAPPGPDPFAPLGPTSGGDFNPQALCGLLPERLRAICRAGTGEIFGPGAPGGQFGPLPRPAAGEDCPPGSLRFGDTCVDPSAFLPFGDPLTFPADGGGVVQGGFGLPAMMPSGVTRVTRKCPRGMVLGIDDLCYAKAILPPRSKLRKWRRPPRPPITRRDTVAIRRAAGARDRVFELAKDVGLHVAKTPHRKKAKT